MPSFDTFDSRGYRTVDVREGYGAWVSTYEDTVEDKMDLELLASLSTVKWDAASRVADLACGTGRTGAWLREQGAAADTLHGVDLTPEMLSRARARGEHDRLLEADVADTGLDADAYDLVIASLVDEHLASLRPLYREARRLTTKGAPFVIVGIHPFFVMAAGMPTHFTAAGGEEVAIETHVHLLSEHLAAAQAAGWQLAELHEAVVDDEWIARKASWERWRDHPISYAAVWR